MKKYSKEFQESMIDVEVVNISNNPNPEYETDWDAGCDVRADFSRITPENPIKLKGDGQFLFKNNVNSVSSVILNPGARALIPTGLFVSVPKGYEIQVRPRSGLSFKVGLTLINSPGTIDTFYRSECGLLVINHGDNPVVIEDGERIGQFVLNKVAAINWVNKSRVSEFSDLTDRGGGYGHSGTK